MHIRENRRCNQEWTILRNWQHVVNTTRYWNNRHQENSIVLLYSELYAYSLVRNDRFIDWLMGFLVFYANISLSI
jgi:hypothetical protein